MKTAKFSVQRVVQARDHNWEAAHTQDRHMKLKKKLVRLVDIDLLQEDGEMVILALKLFGGFVRELIEDPENLGEVERKCLAMADRFESGVIAYMEDCVAKTRVMEIELEE
jgi:hypothetical protein